MAFQSGILGMFARSPFKPLQKHMDKAYDCVALLEPFLQAALQGEWDKAGEIRDQIGQLEHDADRVKMDFRQHLPKNLFLPVPRIDLLQLMSKQEDLPNLAKDITGLMLGRRMQIPEALADDFFAFLRCSVEATEQAKTTISQLDELLESGFRGQEVNIIEKMLNKLNQLEHESDDLQIKLRQKLFDIEPQLEPVDVVFLYKVIDYIGSLADAAQDTGGRLRMLTAD
jgi:predicted phosphate transport protein (TIGR00153 family)